MYRMNQDEPVVDMIIKRSKISGVKGVKINKIVQFTSIILLILKM